jgi:hypothetical protein
VLPFEWFVHLLKEADYWWDRKDKTPVPVMLDGIGRTARVIIVKASSVLNVNMTLMNVQKIASVNVTTT